MTGTLPPGIRQPSGVRGLFVLGRVVQGARVASGLSLSNPYGGGTIALQRPFFERDGLDFSSYHMGTVNVDIAPLSFSLRQAKYTFRSIPWAQGFPPEDFSLSPVALFARGARYTGLLYYPHPGTKIGFHKTPTVMEIIAPFIDGLSYGDDVRLSLSSSEVALAGRFV